MRDYLNIYEQTIDDFLVNAIVPHGKEEFKFTELKRNAIWLTKEMENSKMLRTQLSKIKTLKQLREILDSH